MTPKGPDIDVRKGLSDIQRREFRYEELSHALVKTVAPCPKCRGTRVVQRLSGVFACIRCGKPYKEAA